MRREWIEITRPTAYVTSGKSPSMRREWIEMSTHYLMMCRHAGSPSMRREWIEMQSFQTLFL